MSVHIITIQKCNNSLELEHIQRFVKYFRISKSISVVQKKKSIELFLKVKLQYLQQYNQKRIF